MNNFKMSISEWGKTYTIEHQNGGVEIAEIHEDYIYLLRCMGFSNETIAKTLIELVETKLEDL